ncbi:type II toxin-antitoxin system VapC family toxin [Brevibacillus humidisoli]|uniref:type II toxin-antitoxin system VapC family toxin n=1 Tax=Brevibacillus humidisoli TaxID=2895522 RepID=UPI001E51353B|nr:type II toxin-antitoxin system VapC family toxin [Brevibacillus humidisoli]UFJ40383.1 type II toxin-antitoxin system VapC family toxin [Brevibacillus humidisoli]
MERLIADLKQYGKVAIDTNALIYLMEKHPLYHDPCKEVFSLIEKGHLVGITSVLLLTEVLTKPLKDNNEGLVRAYKAVISTFPNLVIKQIDKQTSVLAAELRAKYGVKTPDALFLATAIMENADVFVTNDVRLKRIEEMNFLVLDEYKE